MEDIFNILIAAGVLVPLFRNLFRKGTQETKTPPEEQGIPLPHKAAPPQPPKRQRKTSAPKPFIPGSDRQTALHRTGPATQAPAPRTAAGQEAEHTATGFDLQSAEEVRRGILWAEILNRKY